jgi:hypothetical protein
MPLKSFLYFNAVKTIKMLPEAASIKLTILSIGVSSFYRFNAAKAARLKKFILNLYPAHPPRITD